MGRNVPPNWGRSFPGSRSDGPPVELVRVELPTSADLTLYLGDPFTSEFLWPNFNETVITWGNGGTSRDLSVTPSVRGNVLHFVASRLVVRSKNFVNEDVPTDQFNLVRVSAMAALGRPSAVTRVLFNNEHSNDRVVAGEAPKAFTLSPWAESVRIVPTPGAPPVNLDLVTVAQGNRMPGGDTVGTARPVSEYSAPMALHPMTNILVMENTNPTGAVGIAIIETFLL